MKSHFERGLLASESGINLRLMLHVVINAPMSHYRFSFPSTVEHCRQLRQYIGVIARIEGYDEAFTFALELTVHEAFINAVRHGNREDPTLLVVVSLLTTAAHSGGRSLEVRVRDCGQGFDPAPFIAEASLESSLSRAGGRGLYLMSYLAENIGIEKLADGCVVILNYIHP